MRLTVVLPSIALLISTVSAGCFSGGEKWIRPRTNWTPKKACEQLANKTYQDGEEQAARFNIEGGFCNNFVLKNIGGHDRYIDVGECEDGMNKEFYGCAHGGRTGYKNWEYTGDPNKGPCE